MAGLLQAERRHIRKLWAHNRLLLREGPVVYHLLLRVALALWLAATLHASVYAFMKPVSADTSWVRKRCDSVLALFPVSPDSHYLYSGTYGWFDRSHFGTGDPAQLLVDVGRAVARGGGEVSVQQGLHGGLSGYTAHYWVSGEVTAEQVTGVALGIYLDWSRRFEAWQERPPRNLLAPFTPFAIEDLPSQYLGFFAAAHRLPMETVLACYMGDVAATQSPPPRLVSAAERPGAGAEAALGIRRLVNPTFLPLVPTQEGWKHVPWPHHLRITPIGSLRDRWFFLGEETWYFDRQFTLAAR